MTAARPRHESASRFTWTQRLILAIAPRIVWVLIMLVGRTWRFEVLAEDGVTPAFHGFTPGREIYCFWHQCVLPCAYYFRRTGATILISQSFDGELITRTLKLLGYRAVRGSSSRGGQQGLIGLQRVLNPGTNPGPDPETDPGTDPETGRGTPAIFTADGPRGPIYRAKMGPVKLAQLTGAPIGSFHLQPERAWIMRSWDRFLVPKPFTRIAVSWGQWTIVPEEATNDELHAWRDQLDVVLEQSRTRAIEHLSRELT